MFSRRTFFSRTSKGLAGVAMPALLAADVAAGPPAGVYQAQAPHFRPRARNVIFMFQIGAPSQLDMFDPKPELNKREGDPLPQSFLDRVNFAQIVYPGKTFRLPGFKKLPGDGNTNIFV